MGQYESPEFVPLQATESLVDALNHAMDLDVHASARIKFLLGRLQLLLKRDTRAAMWLMNDLQRDPAPRITSRTVVRPDDDDGDPGDLAQAQEALDRSAPLSRSMVRSVLISIRTPITLIVSQAGHSKWFADVLLPMYLQPMGYVDCVASMWAATEDHAIFLVVHRRASDPPFAEQDVTLISLMLRATAPILDREIFQRRLPDIHEQLSPRERQVLTLLLAGDSEKQIAAALSRSVNTVHTFVRQIYRHFNVASRGELMAKFIDKAVLASLQQEDAPSISAG